jgi:hypothetical protein
MRSRLLLVLTAGIIALFILDCASLFARGRGGGGRGGGGFSRGGGSFSRGGSSFSRGGSNFSGGERSFSRGGGSFSGSSSFSDSGSFSRGGGSSFSSGNNSNSRGGGGSFSASSSSFSRGSSGSSSGSYSIPADSPLFSDLGGSRPSGGRVPSSPARGQSGGGRPSMGGSATQLPSGNRPGRDIGSRPSQIPARNEGGTGARPGKVPTQRPGRSDAGNFLGIASGIGAGVALGGAAANRPSQLPANRLGGDQRPAPPNQRPNWSARSLNRDYKWRERVYKRNDAWNERANQRQAGREDFQKNREERWDNLQSRSEDRQNFRDQRREDWQQYRKDLWDYRADRAEEIWDNARDFYDDVFDDAWWGYWGWGTWWPGYYPSDPWWWWSSATWNSLANFVSVPTDPTYVDYGVNVVYEGDTVYVDNQPFPAEQYDKPILEAAANVKQPPPPLPPSDPNQPTEWMPLGVFALAQEDRGDPVMFLQLSINQQGIISGAFQSTITNDTRPVAGQVEKASQRAAWRIGDNAETIFETTLGNLTQDVSPIAVHFGNSRTQTWLLVRMPEPAPAGQPQKLPEAPKSPPPLQSPKT